MHVEDAEHESDIGIARGRSRMESGKTFAVYYCTGVS